MPEHAPEPLEDMTFWTPARKQALVLVFRGRQSMEAIARDVGISRRTLFNWRHHPVFVARFEAALQAYRAHLAAERAVQWRFPSAD